jgi:ABC-type lipoprotein export system ATPase subunit
MKITRIKIANLRAITELDLDLTSAPNQPLDLVMLAGSNGCGKTSVLEACLWALNQDALVSRTLPRQAYSIELDIAYDDEHYRISRNPETHTIQARDQKPTALPKKGLPTWLTLKAIYFSSWRAPKLIGSVPLSTGRGKRPTRSPQNALWRLKQYLVNLTGLRGISGFQETQTVKIPELVDRVMDLWREFYPGTNGRFEVRIATRENVNAPIHFSVFPEETSDDELTFDLFLIDKDHPQGISVDELSSGEIEVLSMIGSFLLERIPYDLVLVDEPELHLHPAWHRTIINVLRRAAPDSQIICATHSEHILDSVYSHERFTLLSEADPRLRLVQQELPSRA